MYSYTRSQRGWRQYTKEFTYLTISSSLLLLGFASPIYAITIPCDVAIIGGGPGGTHTAYKLITLNLTQGNVCLFEKRDHLGGRVGDNFNIGLDSGQFSTNSALDNRGLGRLVSFTMDPSEVGQTGTGGYRMNYNHYTRFLGQELANVAANNGNPGKLALILSRTFSRLLEVDNPGFNSAFNPASLKYFTYDNFGIAKAFAPLYNSSVNNNDMWKIQLCGPQVPLDSNFHPHYELMDGKHVGQDGHTTVDIRNMNALDYLEWVTSHIISPNDPIVAQQVAQYFVDTWRFRADYSSTNNPVSYTPFTYVPNDIDGTDAASYLNFNATDFTGGVVVYPIPSFQPYFDIMAGEITKSPKGNIFLNEPVIKVSTDPNSSGYIITTTKATYPAKTVIIATNWAAITKITGDVISALTTNRARLRGFTYGNNGDMYNSVATSVALTITQQYGGFTPNSSNSTPNSGWWNKKDPNGLQSILYPSGNTLLGPQLTTSSNPLLRSTNNNHIPGVQFTCNSNAVLDQGYTCTNRRLYFNHVLVSFSNNTNELPLSDYHDFINISRSVYNDSPVGFRDWRNLFIAGGDAAVTAQIKKSMEFMYPTVFTAIDPPTPQPILTTNPIDGTSSMGFSQVTLHDPAWYSLTKGSLAKGITNRTLFQWSLNPLPGHGERVYLVGDTWRNDEIGWSDGAYKGSIYVLNNVFGAGIDPKEPSVIKCISGDIVAPN